MGLIKKAALAALGLEVKLREVVEELVQKGEANNSEGARSIKSLLEKADKAEREIRREEARVVEQVSHKLNMPTRSDIDRIHKKLDDLTAALAATRTEKL